jgi:hypothetical protein
MANIHVYRERNKAVTSYYNQHSIDVAAAKVFTFPLLWLIKGTEA